MGLGQRSRMSHPEETPGVSQRPTTRHVDGNSPDTALLSAICRSAMRIAYWSTLALVAGMAPSAQPVDRNKPFPAHKVIGNVYFVGTANLGSYLITTTEGHILVNTDYETTVPQIPAGMAKLGLQF